MKRILVCIAGFVLLLAAAVPISAHGDTDPYQGTEHIKDADIVLTIETDGTVKVREGFVYDFSDLSRHGIFRDVPFVKSNSDGKKYAMDFSGVTVTDEEGSAYPYIQSEEGEMVRFRIGDADKTVTGVHSYLIGYTVSGALTYFPGHDELYWNVTGNDWKVPISEVHVDINFPDGIRQEDMKVQCYTGVRGSAANECTVRLSGPRTATVTSTRPLLASEGLTIVAGLPKGAVAVLEPKELVPFFDTWVGKMVLVVIVIGALIWYIVLPVLVVWKWWTTGRDPKPAMGEVRAWFSPPQNPRRRPLTPAETGTLVDERADLRDIYASIIDLARRGYLTIIETKKSTFDLEKRNAWEGDHEVLPFERELLNGIFKTGERVSVKSIDLIKTLEKVKSMLYESLVQDGFFPSNPNTLRGWYILLAVFSFIIFNPILLLVSLIFGQNMPRKTLFGAEQAAVARSLKNFLVSQDKKLAFQAKNQMMFEKLLAFAVAFGVERIWAERFKTLGVKQPEWYVSSTHTRFNSVAFAHSIGSGMSASFASSIAAHSSTGHSSGFSGGSSGGGGGGGGGGSW